MVTEFSKFVEYQNNKYSFIKALKNCFYEFYKFKISEIHDWLESRP